MKNIGIRIQMKSLHECGNSFWSIEDSTTIKFERGVRIYNPVKSVMQQRSWSLLQTADSIRRMSVICNPNPEGDQQCKGSSRVYVVNMEWIASIL